MFVELTSNETPNKFFSPPRLTPLVPPTGTGLVSVNGRGFYSPMKKPPELDRKLKRKQFCPTCRYDMTQPAREGTSKKDCPQCGQGLSKRTVIRLHLKETMKPKTNSVRKKRAEVRVERIVSQIVTCLFRVSNGSGYTEGNRIAVKVGDWPNEKELGGWCKEAASQEIREILAGMVKLIETPILGAATRRGRRGQQTNKSLHD